MELHFQGFLTLFERDFPLFIFTNPAVASSCQTQSSFWNSKVQWQVIVKASSSSQSSHHCPCGKRWPAAGGEVWPAFPFSHTLLCLPNGIFSEPPDGVGFRILGYWSEAQNVVLRLGLSTALGSTHSAGTLPCLEVWVPALHGLSSERLRFHNPTSSLCSFSPRLVTASCVYYFCIS